MLTFPRVATFALAALALTGCGYTYTPARTAGFEIDSTREIDDADIQKAFAARPQLPGDIHVAYYTFDPVVAKDVEDMLAAVPGVTSVYRIPPLLITGQRRSEEGNAWAPRSEVTVKKLRLLAARAHCDALVILDHGYKTGGANGLSALGVLVVPIFFAPMVDTTVNGYAEAFLVDVRNGYLYGQVSEDDKRGKEYATIYDKGTRELAAEQWQALRASLQKDLGRLVASERGRAPEALPAIDQKHAFKAR